MVKTPGGWRTQFVTMFITSKKNLHEHFNVEHYTFSDKRFCGLDAFSAGSINYR